MSKSTVDEHIKALPVLRRFSSRAVARELMPSVTAAARVATLPEKVQDAILTDAPKRNTAADKAKAARAVQRKAETEGREATEGIRHAEDTVARMEERLGLSIEAMSETNLEAFQQLLLTEAEDTAA